MAEEKKTSKKADKAKDKKSGKDKNKSKKNPFKSIAGFFKSVNSEGKKVVWPKAKEVFKNTLIVLVVMIIVGAVIYGIDTGLAAGMKGIKKAAQEKTTVSDTAASSTTAQALDEATTPDTAE